MNFSEYVNAIRAYLTPGSGVWRRPTLPSRHAADHQRHSAPVNTSRRPKSKAHYLRPIGRTGGRRG